MEDVIRPETIAVVLARLQNLEDRFCAAITEKSELTQRIHFLEERVRYLEGTSVHMNGDIATLTTCPSSGTYDGCGSVNSSMHYSKNARKVFFTNKRSGSWAGDHLSGALDPLTLGAIPSPMSASKSAPPMGAVRDPCDNIVISTNGQGSQIVTWKIENVKSKLKMSAGKPVVSPQFALGRTDLKLMLFPYVGTALGEVRSGRELRTRERQQRFEHLVNNGPMGAALRLKANSAQGENLRYKLFVGHLDLGSFTTDFSDHIIHGTEDDGIKDLLSCFEEENDKAVVVCRLEVLPDIYDLQAPPGLFHDPPTRV